MRKTGENYCLHWVLELAIIEVTMSVSGYKKLTFQGKGIL